MYGAGMGYFAQLLAGGPTQVVEIHDRVNPAFPGMRSPEPIALNLTELVEEVVEGGAAVGIATDGDADRLGVVDERGQFITQLQVCALLLVYLLEVRGERGAIVRTVTGTKMADRLAQLYGLPLYETPVGFKYVGPRMMETDAIFGGEESGGYGFRGHIPERDGILSGLFFLELIAKMEKSPRELVEYLYQKVGPHYYDRVDVHFPAEQRETIVARLRASRLDEVAGVTVERIGTEDGFKYELVDGSWLLIRFSGTEPILRIYSEAATLERVGELLSEGQRLTGLAED
jgi:phosphomannomutase